MLPMDIDISIITNLSIKLENNKIYNLLKQRPNVRWNISFDNIADQFEYVRHGAEWDTLLHNLSLLKQDFDNNRMSILAVYGIWSATSANKLIHFTNEQNINITWQLANNASFEQSNIGIFSIFDHDYRIRELALEEARRSLAFVQNCTDVKYIRNVNENSNFFSGIIDTLEKSLLVKQSRFHSTSEKFLRWTEENENLMPPKKSFRELWPELYDIMIDK
jgi:hypothetical protein